MIIEANHLDAYYGKAQVLHDITFHVNDGEVVSFIGANGAGKSTLMKTIMGMVSIGNGEILFKGEKISGKKTHQIVKKGIVYVPEGRKIFPDFTVEENLYIGAYIRKGSPQHYKHDIEEIYAIFPRLKERLKQKAGSLSGGEQQMLAIARGLMASPKLLMLDEPSMGLAPIVVEEMFEAIAHISSIKKIPVLLVEQNAYMAFSISSRCYVLENGRIALSGTTKELSDSEEIQKSYLGGR